jgi:hypothetical protein
MRKPSAAGSERIAGVFARVMHQSVPHRAYRAPHWRAGGGMEGLW